MKKGKCHCGQVSYEISGDKQFEFFCHCSDCRVINGGGHLAGIIFDKNNLIVTGTPKTYSYIGGSGKKIEFNFCPNCGTPLYAYPLAHENVVVIRATSLENSDTFKPQKSLFSESAHLWENGIIGH